MGDTADQPHLRRGMVSLWVECRTSRRTSRCIGLGARGQIALNGCGRLADERCVRQLAPVITSSSAMRRHKLLLMLIGVTGATVLLSCGQVPSKQTELPTSRSSAERTVTGVQRN